MDELTQLANKYKTDKGILETDKIMSHGYTKYYYDNWKDIRTDVKNILEIGIGAELQYTKNAASLKMMKDFFPNAQLYGIDVQNSLIQEDRIITYLCNQEDKERLTELFSDIEFDIIMDDGGHNTLMQQKTLGHLFKYVKSGGMYIVEDLHTSVWGDWGLPANDENCCLKVLERFNSDNEITTPYMTDEEKDYLNNNILSIEIIDTKKNGINNDLTSIIYKK